MAGVVALTTGCVGASPPSGPRNPPDEGDVPAPEPDADDDAQPALRLGAWDFSEEDGALVVTTEVINDAPSERSGTVVATVTVGDETITAREEVVVAPGETVEVALTVDVAYDRFEADGSLTLALDRS